MKNIFYINLEKRIDRKEHIENEFKKLDVFAERINGIYDEKKGILGCVKSHILCLSLAIERNYDNIMIIEDDMKFIFDRNEVDKKINYFVDKIKSWDVLLLAGVTNHIKFIDIGISKVIDVQAGICYIVNKHYMKILKEELEESAKQLSITSLDHIYSMDIYWKKLQKRDNWYILTPNCGYQIPSYSDANLSYNNIEMLYKKPFTVKLAGGLGNRLFQFAFGYTLSKKMGYLFYLKNEIKNDHSSINYDFIFSDIPKLDIEPTKVIHQQQNELSYFDDYYLDYLQKYEFDGYFAREDYFKLCKNEIIDLYLSKFSETINNLDKYPLLGESYFIHVRKGDYINNPIFGVNLEHYYKNCFRLISKNSDDVHFYVFSDDLTWCSNNLTYITNKTPIMENEIVSLYLMSKCYKGGICSNSTFSWWGSYLNKNVDKKVYFPSKWYLTDWNVNIYPSYATIITVDKIYEPMKGPIKEIPKNILNEYTMNGKIPVFDWYFDENYTQFTEWTYDYVESFIKNITRENILNGKHGEESYKNASLHHCWAFDEFNIKDKDVAIIGSLTPWIEAICINYNAKSVTTVEYNVPKCNHPKIKCISYDEFKKGNYQFDCIITYSSIEHSGLGRYGDYLDPDGDIKTMKNIHKSLKNDGLLFCGIPVGKDALVWNAHRIYGKIRLPYLFQDFIELKWFGYGKAILDILDLTKWGDFQSIIVLKKSIIRTLFDIGANKGNYTLANINKYDKIVLVDANYQLCKEMKLPDKCVIENCIVSSDKNVPFYINKDSDTISTASTFWINEGRFSKNNSWECHNNIPTMSIDDLVNKYGIPSYIKIDVEGYEKNVIKSMSKYYCELSFEWAEESLSDIFDTITYLKDIGYNNFAIQYKDDYTFIPNEYISYDNIMDDLKKNCKAERKELWGMIHCRMMEKKDIETLYKLYIVNYKDNDRRQKMTNRFNKIGIDFEFTNGVGPNDQRIKDYQGISPMSMLAYMDVMKKFYDSGNDKDGPFYCIICEDDIYVRKTFKDDILKVIKDFDTMKLDILLLGYLLNRKIVFDDVYTPKSYTYHSYPDDLWGAQMCMFSRKHIKYFLDKYTVEWAINNRDKPFSGDWILTKDGNRSIIYPMLAVEEGGTKSTHQGQIDFHKQCSLVNYDPNLYY